MLDHRSSSDEKIALFRSLFRGRADVYPRRFESRKTGQSGYAPACANEWVRGVCEKPRIKCAECPTRRFLPVTDDVIRWHLSGRDPEGQSFVAGVYPLLLDETCFFLAVDFDKAGWQDDASAFLRACHRLGVPAALERSRSGSGGHVWCFLTRPCRQRWCDAWAPTCSPRRWRAVPTSGWIPTIASFPTRTRCRRVASAT